MMQHHEGAFSVPLSFILWLGEIRCRFLHVQLLALVLPLGWSNPIMGWLRGCFIVAEETDVAIPPQVLLHKLHVSLDPLELVQYCSGRRCCQWPGGQPPVVEQHQICSALSRG